MKNLFLLLVASATFIACTKTEAAKGTDPINKAGTNCATVTGSGGAPDWKYCMHRYTNSSDDLLIYFHGNGGNEHDWEDGVFENTMRETWKIAGIQPPIVVSISFGDTWLLAEQNTSPMSGLFDYFLGAVMPVINDKLKDANIDKTYLMGVSMGGFNAAQLYLKVPNLFSRVALVCPAMATITPYASSTEINQYINTTKADPAKVAQVIQLGQAFFPTVSDWNKHSPNILAAQKLNGSFPPLYVSNGAADPYGFTYANKLFAEKAQQMGAQVKWNFYAGGGHCSVNGEDLAMALIPN